jgi:hypothetical protein
MTGLYTEDMPVRAFHSADDIIVSVEIMHINGGSYTFSRE